MIIARFSGVKARQMRYRFLEYLKGMILEPDQIFIIDVNGKIQIYQVVGHMLKEITEDDGSIVEISGNNDMDADEIEKLLSFVTEPFDNDTIAFWRDNGKITGSSQGIIFRNTP